VTNRTAYESHYAIPPGDSLRETLEAIGMTQAEFARRADLSTKHVNQIVKGDAALTPDTALAIERVTGVPSRLWLRLEARYRTQLLAIQEETEFEASELWLRSLPVRELADHGWIAHSSDRPTLVRQLLAFFGVASIDAWKAYWPRELARVQLRQSGSGTTHQTALAAWLRTGEVVARNLELATYDETTFRASFRAIRLATRTPRTAAGTVQAICASSGVAFVITDAFAGTRANGAARWLGPDRPLIHLSRRWNRDDSLWFSFFHEVGHLLLHSKRAIHVDQGADEAGGAEVLQHEAEANAFARRELLPGVTDSMLDRLHTLSDVQEFAQRVGVAPSIVVGQLHHLGRPPSWGRCLIRSVQLPGPSSSLGQPRTH
jgi:HTH-type transcriptional regulator/antitoxin HigA